ncbi:MAG: 2-hydroxychromene-2-carboxylate isomerase, partial [Pseudomonadota bacterium]
APEVKAQLKRFGEEALAAGVFGVPSLVIDGELFWGFDATAMARDFLEDPSWLRSGEFSRIDELPAGVMRKEAGG